MPGVTGHGILSRVRSHKKLRTQLAAEDLETPRLSRRRQHSEGSIVARSPPSTATRADFPGHWPPIEWDPLKLNPPVPAEAPHAPARLHERQPLQCLRTTKRAEDHRRPPRLHHSASGLSLRGYQDFDFGLEKAKAQHIVDQSRRREHEVDYKGWPSPASSVDSGKSWFDYDDDEDDFDDEEADVPLPRRRPPIGSPDDPTDFLKRGEWKRRGIFFGVQAEKVHKEVDAFEV